MIAIKLRVANEFRRFAIKPSTTLQELNAFVTQRLLPHAQFKAENIVYYYLDQDEDWIKVTIEEDWLEAMSFAQEYNDQYLALRLAVKQDKEQRHQHCKRAEHCRRNANPWLNLLHSVFAEQKQNQCQNAMTCPKQQQQPASKNLESLLQQKMSSVKVPAPVESQPAKRAIVITEYPSVQDTNTQQLVADTKIFSNAEPEATIVKQQEQEPVVEQEAPAKEEQQPNVEQIVLDSNKQQEAATEQAPTYQVELNILNSMGFSNTKLNIHLLNNFKGSMAKVIDALLTAKV